MTFNASEYTPEYKCLYFRHSQRVHFFEFVGGEIDIRNVILICWGLFYLINSIPFYYYFFVTEDFSDYITDKNKNKTFLDYILILVA